MEGIFLLDTHAFLWAMTGSSQLSQRVKRLFAEPDIRLLLSAASVWEIALKAAEGKINAPGPVVDEAIEGFRIRELPVRRMHVRKASDFPAVEGHKDPFDRLIAAQAVSERVPLITNDRSLTRHYPEVATFW
jgi:PIN domain nuclease of toxin-antitoxin system